MVVIRMKFIDLFAGMGGTRIGFEQACEELGIQSECVFTSEIKQYATKLYQYNFHNEEVYGDITKVNTSDIPDFDFLLGGFPCQAFSSAGKKLGFNDARGTLFFDIARILKDKQPAGFLLENVEGLVTHDKQNKSDKIGRTLQTILKILMDLGYKTTWSVIDSSEHGVPQKRKRVYIVGTKTKVVSLENLPQKQCLIKDILEQGLPTENTEFKQRLLTLYSKEHLYGKSIKDKRGGKDNIHSWDLELKGSLTKQQKVLMNKLLKERRKKHWAKELGIDWMDGMPLTTNHIHSFMQDYKLNDLQKMLDDLVEKSYLRLEPPKKLVKENNTSMRVYDYKKPNGYNIVTGKLSFELNKILDPNGIVNTIVATETDRLGVIDGDGLRTLSERECLRLFGFPESYRTNIPRKQLYDLIGNTVVVPVIKLVSNRVIKTLITDKVKFVA